VKQRALALLLVVAATACGDRGGVLVEVSQSLEVGGNVDKLHLFVGTPDADISGFSGVALPTDVIALSQPLSEQAHTIELIAGNGMPEETPVRIAVVGKAGDDVIALGILDVPRIPTGHVLRYELVLEPIDDVLMTDSGCLLLPDGTVVAAFDDQDCDGVTRGNGDCDDLNPQVHPGAYDACDASSLGVDDDCNGTPDDGDKDSDLSDCQSDCDDLDPERTPGRSEDCVDGADNDCDFEIDEGVPEICDDQIDNDCDPVTPDTSGVEVCGDGYDNDCDSAIDEGRDGDDDVDQDGFNCANDCDDDDFFVNPEAVEVCNFTDDDCDEATDEEANDDGDPAPCLFDCDDGDADRFPGNPEICDTVDNDCVGDTHAAPAPCLDYAIDPCAYGLAACDESTGVYGVCAHEASGVPAPDGVCQQFASCTDSNEGLACAGQPTHRCQQLVTDVNEVCAGASVPLQTPANATTCTWAVLGGPTQQGWVVGLLAQGSADPAPTASTCIAQFAVVAVPPGLQPGTFLVVAFSGGLYHHTEVFVIGPQRENVCAIPSLTCTSTSGG
jgi:hypothetical protein